MRMKRLHKSVKARKEIQDKMSRWREKEREKVSAAKAEHREVPTARRGLEASVPLPGDAAETEGEGAEGMHRRLLRAGAELERADSELRRHRDRSERLAQAKLELGRRERALSGQVDAAIAAIAGLCQRLSASQQELERKEQEVVTIHRFLEVAIQRETRGKVRLQDFIESLLQRIALAEKLLKYYQSSSGQPHCTAHSEMNQEMPVQCSCPSVWSPGVSINGKRTTEGNGEPVGRGSPDIRGARGHEGTVQSKMAFYKALRREEPGQAAGPLPGLSISTQGPETFQTVTTPVPGLQLSV